MQFTVQACLVLDLLSETQASDICVEQSVSGSVGPVTRTYSGNVAFSDTAAGSAFTGFLRVTIADSGVVSTIRVVEGTGSYTRSFIFETFCGIDNTLARLPVFQTSTTPTIPKFVPNGSFGDLLFEGTLHTSSTNLVRPSRSCDTVVSESDDPTVKGLAAFPFITVEIANGVVQAIVLDQTTPSGDGGTRVYSGRLALDP